MLIVVVDLLDLEKSGNGITRRSCHTCFPRARDPHPLGVQVYRDELQRFLGFAAAWLE